MRVRASLLPILLVVAGCQAPNHGDAPRNATPAPVVRVETQPPAPPAPEWPHVVVCPRAQHPPRTVTRAPAAAPPRESETMLASIDVVVPGLDERPLAAANEGGYVVPAIFAKPPEPPRVEARSAVFEPAAPTHASPIEAGARALVVAKAALPAPSAAPVPDGSHSLLPLIALAALAVAVWLFVIVTRAKESADVDPILDTIVDTIADEDEVYVFLDSIEELALDP